MAKPSRTARTRSASPGKVSKPVRRTSVAKRPRSGTLDKWAKHAASGEARPLTMPIAVLLGEAADMAAFAEHYWAPKQGQAPLPGLQQALGGGGLTPELRAELTELTSTLQEAQTAYSQSAPDRTGPAPVERGRAVLREIAQTLEYLFDDGVRDAGDAHLAQLRRDTRNVGSHDALAHALEQTAALGEHYGERIQGLGGFDVALLLEARQLAVALRGRHGRRATSRAADDRRRARELRDGIARLLMDRMRILRRAARFVFRNHPAIARRATSAYERDRARARRRKLREG